MNIITTKQIETKGGYTLIELLLVMAIIFLLAGTSLVNYNQFGKEIDLENMTYNVALTVRTAQAFGINRREEGGVVVDDFAEAIPYGIYFTTQSLVDVLGDPNDEGFMIFIDNKDGTVPGSNNLFDNSGSGGACVVNSADECIDIFRINKEIYISEICAGDDATSCIERDELHITFKRPNPDAIIKSSDVASHSYAEIVLSSRVALGFNQVISVGVAGDISITKRAILP